MQGHIVKNPRRDKNGEKRKNATLKAASNSQYWRKGYMKESRKLIYDDVFNQLQVDVLHADVWKGNINSERSLESAGYQFLFEQEELFEKYDRVQMKRCYQLTKEVWIKRHNE